jgi:hypothetical protein
LPKRLFNGQLNDLDKRSPNKEIEAMSFYINKNLAKRKFEKMDICTISKKAPQWSD